MINLFLMALVRVLTGAVVRSHGFSFDPPVQRLYYANHTSNLDTLLIWSIIPRKYHRRVRPAAAKDYWWGGPVRRYVAEKLFHAIPVERHSADPKTNNPLSGLEAALTDGDSLIFFPEGKRADGPELLPFKSGIYHMIKKFPHVELVPIYIDNLIRVMPKGEALPVPIVCTVRFGAGFKMEQEEEKDAFLERARNKLEALRAV